MVQKFEWNGHVVEIETDSYVLFGKQHQQRLIKIDGKIVLGESDFLFGNLSHFIKVKGKGYRLKNIDGAYYLVYEGKEVV